MTEKREPNNANAYEQYEQYNQFERFDSIENNFTVDKELTIKAAIAIALKHLKDVKIESAERESEWIVMHCTGKDSTQIWADSGFVLSENEVLHVAECVSRRVKRLPLQYIFGECEFFGHKFIVSEDVLIPRIDSEVLVEEALKFASKICNSCNSHHSHKSHHGIGSNILTIVDLCCGSGALGCALNIELLPVLNKPKNASHKNTGKIACKTMFIDVSEDALNVARKNARLHAVKAEFVQANALNNSFMNAIESIVDCGKNVGDNIEDNASDSGDFGGIDVMLFNPPYVKSDDINLLSEEVRAEPRLALDGGENGLEFYEYVVPKLPNILSKRGRCFIEIGFNQYSDVRDIISGVGGLHCDIKKDAEMRDRVVCVWRA